MSREHLLLMFPPLLLGLYCHLLPHQEGPDPAWLGELPLHTLSENKFQRFLDPGNSTIPHREQVFTTSSSSSSATSFPSSSYPEKE
jgi:hypothetical protein